MMGGSTKASVEEIAEGSEDALAKAIGNMDAVDGASVAGLLDARMPTAGTLATKADTGGGVDWSTKTITPIPIPEGNTWNVDSTATSTTTKTHTVVSGAGNWAGDWGVPTYLKGTIDNTPASDQLQLSDWYLRLLDGGTVIEEIDGGAVVLSSTETYSTKVPVAMIPGYRFENGLTLEMYFDWDRDGYPSDSTSTDITAELVDATGVVGLD